MDRPSADFLVVAESSKVKPKVMKSQERQDSSSGSGASDASDHAAVSNSEDSDDK